MSATETVTCRAKDPSTCRFHGTTQTVTIQDLTTQAHEAARARDNTKYWAIRDDIRARELEEYEMRKASWTDTDKKEAANAFLTQITTAPYTVKETSPKEYEIDDSDSIKETLDYLEDNEIEVDINYAVSDYDIIREAHIPILDITLTNSSCNDEIREHVPAHHLPEDYWYDG